MRNTALAAPAGVFHLHANARGDVAAVSDASGAVVERTRFEDFGLPDAASATGNPFGFQGRRRDPETGLYDFRARHYDPRDGRFVQRDPVHDPANLGNAYTFAGNGPVSNADPFGTRKLTIGGFILFDTEQTPQAALGAVKGVGNSLYGFGEAMGAIVVGGGATWAGADPKGYFKDAMRKYDQIGEGMVAVVDKPSILIDAPRRQFHAAIDRGDAFGASEVYGQFAFDTVTLVEDIASVARVGVQHVKAVRAANAKFLAKLDELKAIDDAARNATDALYAADPRRIFDKADYKVSAHGELTGDVIQLPDNVTVRAYANFAAAPGLDNELDVAANDLVPDGATYELVSGPMLHSDLFQWNGDGSFTITPLTLSGQIPFTYQVRVGTDVFGPVSVTVGTDRDLLVDLPTFTDPGTGELAVSVPTLILGGRNFPVHQFRLSNNPADACSPPHWHAAVPVFSLEEPVENPLFDPDPPECGFGILAAVPQGSVTVDLDVWNAFLGLHPPL